jgi:hypothetical protein
LATSTVLEVTEELPMSPETGRLTFKMTVVFVATEFESWPESSTPLMTME